MKQWIVLVVLSVGLSLTGPACVPPGTWPKVAQCGPSASDLLPTVSRLLLDGGAQMDPERLSEAAMSELEKLAVKHGADAVACLIDQLVQDWFGAAAARTKAGYEVDGQQMLGVQRGAQFLHDRGVQSVEH